MYTQSMQAVCPPCNTPVIFVSPATFPPTERLTAPASYLPRAVRCGDERRMRTSVPFTMPSGDLGLVAVPGPVTKSLSTGPGTVEIVIDPSAGGGVAQCAGAALRHIFY
jgi:hypothetical protein